jgi:hypothetical protein
MSACKGQKLGQTCSLRQPKTSSRLYRRKQTKSAPKTTALGNPTLAHNTLPLCVLLRSPFARLFFVPLLDVSGSFLSHLIPTFFSWIIMDDSPVPNSPEQARAPPASALAAVAASFAPVSLGGVVDGNGADVMTGHAFCYSSSHSVFIWRTQQSIRVLCRSGEHPCHSR